ncbi:MAG: ATP-binding protein [Anaerolineae bacterium]
MLQRHGEVGPMLDLDLQYQRRQRDYLLKISRAMTSRLDLPSLLRLILQGAAEMVQGEMGLVALAQPDGPMRIEASYGIPRELLPLFEPLLEGITFPSRLGYPLGWQLPDLSLHLQFVSSATGIPLHQVVALPMVLEEEPIGLIVIFRTTGYAFSRNDQQVLESFADQAAIAVRNARLYQLVSAEKRRLSAIIENTVDGIVILDADWRVQVVNRAFSEMTGVSPEQARGQPLRRVLHLSDVKGLDPSQDEGTRLPERGSLRIEGAIVRPGHQPRTVEVSYSAIRDEEDRMVNILVDLHDITRFREAEELKSTFVSVITHELKTPVALIKGYASTLMREDADWDREALREMVGVIEEESDRLDRLINNLLDVSRIEAGALKLEYSEVAIPELARKLVEGYRLQTDRHRFLVDFVEDFPLVAADQERIRQVLSNLIGNAIKYSPDGGTIRIGGWHDSHELTVYVADEGIGIPEGEEERVFERFHRVDSSLRRHTQGAGLGLYLVKALVEAHGGRVWVRSEKGKGATFFFTLPKALNRGES